MEVVLDPVDPSGMFSKAGRASLEMYQMILQKDRILYNKKPVYTPSKAIFKPELAALDGKPLTQITKENSQVPGNNAALSPENQPFSKMTSRGLLQKIEKEDRRFGMYNPKYNLVYRRSPLIEEELERPEKPVRKADFDKEKKYRSSILAARHKKTMSLHSPSSSLDYNYEVKPPKVKGPTPLRLQMGRDRALNYSQDVSEKRFEPVLLPLIYSKTHKLPTVNIGKIAGRSRSNFRRDDCAKGLEYKPKFGLVWPRSAIKVPNFAKGLARKGLESSLMTANQSFSQVDVSSVSLTKVLRTPDFSRMLARERSISEDEK